MIDEGAPLGFVLPDPIPLELGAQMFVLKWTVPATTQLFAVWAATKAQPVVENPAIAAFPGTLLRASIPWLKAIYCRMQARLFAPGGR
jgi:hypothetical protein